MLIDYGTLSSFFICYAALTFERLGSPRINPELNTSLVYLNEVIIRGTEVFEKLSMAKLKSSLKIYIFFCIEINFMGHSISSEGS